MQLDKLGEFGFIERFSEKFNTLLPTASIGIGDDCAVISANELEDYVITTDMLIEGVHFLKDKITSFELGYKSLAVNLSDIAAMGAKPVASFLSLGIPTTTQVENLDAFMEGYHSLSEKHNLPLMGGDTTKSLKHLAINVCVIGRCQKGEARLRSMAKVGDLICVTGNLGDSAGGLQVLLQELEDSECNKTLVKRHHTPTPRIDEGIWLTKYDAVRAMMDISDGISSDLQHILTSSKKGAIIEIDKIPTSETLKKQSKEYNWDIEELSTSGGEDYELLFTIDQDNFAEINKQYQIEFSKKIFVIGEITDGTSSIVWKKHGEVINKKNTGFNHFTTK